MYAFRPIAAAPTASEQATFPLDAQAMDVARLLTASRAQSAVARSLFEPVGVLVSSLSTSPGSPSSCHSRHELNSGVPPTCSGYTPDPSTGKRPRQRQIPSPTSGEVGIRSGP